MRYLLLLFMLSACARTEMTPVTVDGPNFFGVSQCGGPVIGAWWAASGPMDVKPNCRVSLPSCGADMEITNPDTSGTFIIKVNESKLNSCLPVGMWRCNGQIDNATNTLAVDCGGDDLMYFTRR